MASGVPKCPPQDAKGNTYTEELGDRICQLLASGRTLKSICAEPDIPCASTVISWVFRNEVFREKYNVARRMQVEGWADECVEIADDATNDFMEVQKRKGTVVLADHENVNRSKLRIDTRMRLMAKMNPEKYGERVNLGVAEGVSAQLIIRGREKKDDAGAAGPATTDT